jgi:hypothetical protein
MRWVADDEPTSPGAEQNPEGTSDGWRIFKLPRIAFVSLAFGRQVECIWLYGKKTPLLQTGLT